MSRQFVHSAGDKISFASGFGVSTLPVTIVAKVKVNALPSTGRDCFAALGVNSANLAYELLVNSSGTAQAGHINSGAAYSSGATLSTGTWYYLGGTFASNTSRTVYVDGSAGTENTVTKSAITPDIATVGYFDEGSVYKESDSDIEWTCYWSAALTAAEHATIAQGIHPLRIQRASVLDFIDLTRNTQDILGNSWSVTGTSVTTNPGTTLFVPSRRNRVYVSPTSDVSLALTGSSVTVSDGSLGVTVDKALSGEAITSADGSLGVTVDTALTGEAITSADGSLGVDIDTALTGEAITGATGTLTPEVGNIEVALTGSSMTAAAGNVGVAVSKALSGSEITISQGSLTSSGAVIGRRRKTRKYRYNLWDNEDPKLIEQDDDLLNQLVFESIQIGGLAKRAANPYLSKTSTQADIAKLRNDSARIKKLIVAYKKQMDELNREDELLLM